MKKELLLIGAGVAAAGTVIGATASNMITKSLTRLALARELPKAMMQSKPKNEAVRAFHARVEEAGHALRQKDMEEVEITSRDGLRLVGHWYPCENAKRVIVAMHGWRSAWYIDFGMLSDFWRREGCSVLFAEQRAQNNSDGEYMTFGYMERYDCLEWIRFVNERTERKYPVYLAGISMGASTVLMTAGLDVPENVKGVIADCGFTSAYDIWRHVVKKNMKIPFGLFDRLIDRSCKKQLQTNARGISAVTAMQTTKTPILFIHGSDDSFVPVHMTYENYKACNAPKELLIVPGAIHAQSYDKEKEKYEAAVRSFWEKYR
ncbi:MAG: alpha/beta hydrolase [Clostridia bacterium]|nr:alpha/beta hydrolase [Clostridia bacterium]